MLTRRDFFRTAGWGAAAAASISFPSDLLAWAEPSRAPQPGGPILLNSNENAYGPFPSVLALNNPFDGVNRYPDHHSDLVTERLAALHKIPEDCIVTGCGSTEILRISANAFLGPGKKLIMAAPTFEAIDHYAGVVNAEVIKIPLAANFSHDLGAMLRAAGPDTGLVYICNPNNPTANLTPRKDLEDFISKLPKDTYVLMDEAYHDFVGAHPDYVSFIERPLDDPRVIVARTFSKIYGLAGMRMGYGVAAKQTTVRLRRQRLEDSLNIFVMRCGLASLDDTAAHQQAQQRNAADRDQFLKQAAARRLKPIPSSTNFVMMESGRPVRSVIAHFSKNNISVGRPFPPMDTCVRISLGTPEQMKEFWRVWDLLS